MKHWAAILSAFTALFTATARAQDLPTTGTCRLELQVQNNIDWNGPYGRGYEIFADDNYYEVAMLSIRHDGASCDYFLTGIDEDGSGGKSLQGPAGNLAYDVLLQPSGPSILSTDYFGNQLSRISGRFPDGPAVQAIMLYVSIPPGQIVSGGSYSGRALFRLFANDPGAPTLADQNALGVIVPVASAMKVESRDAGPGVRDLAVDLGNLGIGADHALGFRVVSNAAVSAEVQSANHGQLVHYAGAPSIAYRLTMGGQSIDLQGATTPVPVSRTVTPEVDVPLQITVEPQPGAAAGRYSDTLTITFIVDS